MSLKADMASFGIHRVQVGSRALTGSSRRLPVYQMQRPGRTLNSKRRNASRISRLNVGEAPEKVTLVRKVDSEELQVAIQNRDRPMIIDFYATWCGPCVLMATELEKVAEELGDKVEVLKIDTDENPELSSQLRIQGLPTILFVGTDPAKPALRVEGLVPADTVKEILENDVQATDALEQS